VWVHGGGLRNGAGSDYDAGRLAVGGNLVVVTVNYRLGPLGFLGLRALPTSGTLALQDQQAALCWVRRDAAAFGGDPTRVTLAGESGGAHGICAQLTVLDRPGLTVGGVAPVSHAVPGARRSRTGATPGGRRRSRR
jgi:para-nitrobenzyl esterase